MRMGANHLRFDFLQSHGAVFEVVMSDMMARVTSARLAPARTSRVLQSGDAMRGKDGARFVVGEIIGRGGFGEVYRAREERTGNVFALKVLRLKHAADKRTATRLEREAK